MSILTWVEPGDEVEVYALMETKKVKIERGPWETFDNIVWFKYGDNNAAYFSKKYERWQTFRDWGI